MAITTYAELQTAIANNLARSDLTSFMGDFIRMAEDALNYGSDAWEAIRVREMEAITTLTPVSGVAALPSDFLQTVRLVTDNSTRRPLTYITADMVDVYYPARQAGDPAHYTIIGTNLYAYPTTDGDLELTYYQAIPSLSDSATSNWLLAKSPGIYLRASLTMAFDFIKDGSDEMAKQAGMAKSLIAGLNRSDMLGRYARAPLTIRGAVA